MPGTSPPVDIHVTITSEDLGSPPLSGVLLKDFRGFGKEIEYTKLNPQTIVIQPGHLDSPTRRVDSSFRFDADPKNKGCHSVTLAVTHAFKDPGARILDTATAGDLGTATWWYAVAIDDTTPLNSCSIVSGTPTDAGTEAAADPDAGPE